MPVFRHRWAALVLIAGAAAALAYGQRERGTRRGGQNVKPPEQKPERSGLQEKAITRAPRQPALKMPNAKVVVLSLNHANPWEVLNVASSVSSARDDRIQCHVLGGNSLAVASDDDQALANVQKLVAQLDVPQRGESAGEPEICKAVQLEHACAEAVEVYLYKLHARRQSAVRIVGDEHANTVWIAGAERHVAWIVDLARQMDQAAASAGLPGAESQRELHFYALAHADADALAETVTRIAHVMDARGMVVPDVASGTLIAYATPAEHAHLETIVEKLDVPPKQARKRPPPARGKPDEPRGRGVR